MMWFWYGVASTLIVGGFILLGLRMFQKPVADAIPGIESLTIGKWVNARFREQKPQPPQELPPSVDERVVGNLLIPPHLTPHLEAVANWLATQRLSTTDGELAALTRYAAIMRCTADFEAIFNRILGSQLALLAQMASNDFQPIGEVSEVFKKAKAVENSIIREDAEFHQWIAFLVAADLITVAGGSAAVTGKGRAFLAHAVSEGYSNLYRAG